MDEAKKIKVLQVFGSLNMGGAESRMMDIYRNIDKKEVEFDFLTLSKDENQYYEKEIKELNGKIIKIASPRDAGILKHIKELKKIMKEGCYDAVHAHTSYHSGLVMLAAKKVKIPVRITHARTTGSKQKNMLKKLFLKFGKYLINKNSTHRFAVSREAGKFLFNKKEFQVIPNAIDLKRYISNFADKNQIKNNLNIAEEEIIIGHVGRFDSMKNHKFIVEWFNQYRKSNDNIRLLFIGDGMLRKDIEKQVSDLGLSKYISFLGIRGDVPRLISVFDVLIFPSIYEGLPGTVLEAQASGVPVVGSYAIPNEADLGLGLLERLYLDESFQVWNDAVNGAIKKTKISAEKIKKAFDKHGYSIKSVTEKYVNTYKGIK